jgi:uncharacterized protein (TIGR02147 family)
MTLKNVFEFNDYKAYLSHLEQQRSHFSRGFRSRLAEVVGCNNAFVSQVLNTDAHFSLEQAIKLCHYFKHSAEEERFFLFLVEHARAGTTQLRDHFKTLLDEIRDKYLNIKGRVKQQAALTAESQATYYSQWYFAAIHMLVTVPGFRTIKEIATALKLNTKTVEKVVEFLLSCGLLVEKAGEFAAGPSYLHLDRESPNISKHHINLRMAAINSLQDEKKTDVHYSTVSTLSKKDAESLQSKFVQEVQNYVQTVSHSKEETMYCFNLDFFKMIED